MRALLAALLAWLLLIAAAPLHAQDVLTVPALSARVIDQTATLSPGERGQLEARLARLEAERGTQLVVLMVAATQPEDIAAYAQRVADTWKIGRREVGDGVLIVIAKDERRMRIEVAKSLEGALPDLAARQVIDNQLRPAFRNNDYAGGLAQAVERIDQRLGGEGLPTPPPRGGLSEALGAQFEDLGMFLFIAVPVAALFITRLFGRKLGSMLVAGGAGWLAWAFSNSLLLTIFAALATLVVVGLMGIGSAVRRSVRRGDGGPWIGGWGSGGDGWSSGGDGGGFSSGGGGDFGGGGASGDW